ncbi:BatD family protein [Oligoflexaceae bacterium]|nr:BatD family protein [Oligoflexaceae bacterium]
MKLLFLILVWGGVGHADEVSVTAEVDHTIVSLGESLYYSVTIEGGDAEAPQLSQIENIESQYLGPSRQMSIVNGVTQSSTSFRYLLTPTKVGTWSIPATVVDVDGRKYETLPLKVQVTADSSGADDAKGQGNQRPVFVVRSLDRSEAYVGQAVVAKIKLYNRIPLRQPQVDPKTPGQFKRHAIQGQKDYEELVKGVRYRVAEISEVLIPLQAGEMKLPPYEMAASVSAPQKRQRRRRTAPFDMFDDFFNDPFSRGQMIRKTFRSNESKLLIKPLPDGAAADFSGLLGDFKIKSQLSKTKVAAGDTVTLTLSIEGIGNLAGAAPFDSVSFPDVKVYPDKPVIDVRATEKGLLSRGEFKFALVPSRAGDIDLGQVQIQVFNVKAGKYQWLKQSLGTLSVSGRIKGRGEDKSINRRQVEQLNSDMIAIHSGAALLQEHELSWRDFAVAASAWALPIGFGLFGWARRRLKADPRQAREKVRQKAWSRFAKAVKDVDSIAGLHSATRRYFGDRFDQSSESLTWKDVERILAKNKCENAEAVHKVFKLRDQLEFGQIDLSSDAVVKLKDEVVACIENLERQK